MFARYPAYLPSALPPGHGRNRPVVLALETEIDIPELSSDDAPVAIRTRSEVPGRPFDTHAEYRYYGGRLLSDIRMTAETFAERAARPLVAGMSQSSFRDTVLRRTFDNKAGKPWPNGILDVLAGRRGGQPEDRCHAASGDVEIAETDLGAVSAFRQSYETILRRHVFIDGQAWVHVCEPHFAIGAGGLRVIAEIADGNVYGTTEGRVEDLYLDEMHRFSLFDHEAAAEMAVTISHLADRLPATRMPSAEVLLPEALTLDYDLLETRRFADRILRMTRPWLTSGFHPGFVDAWQALGRAVGDARLTQDALDGPLHDLVDIVAGDRRVGSGIDPVYIRLKMERWDNRPIEGPGRAVPPSAEDGASRLPVHGR